jgi:hypothetical protein
MMVDEQRPALDVAGAQIFDRVDRFVDWVRATYPEHNGDAPASIRDCDRRAASDLLGAGYSEELLRAMAIEEWATTSDGIVRSDRSYIAESDRSIRVLQHKAAYLAQQVRGRGQATPRGGLSTGRPNGCPHTPPCVDEGTCTSRRFAAQRAEWEEICREPATTAGSAS